MEEDHNDPDVIGTDEFGIPIYKEINVGELEDANCSETGPRLIISKIVIENFKSYAGVNVLGPFHKNFTAIIGPNGSGKSNVIDSILFVFGFRATKIRSKKLSVLIHDSNDHRGINHCSVTVHFEQILDQGSREDNLFTVLEGSQFEVSRTAFKDGSSYYRIHDRKVHFKEIEKALLSAGVDLVHNRFLILQGEVEQIALMKPKALTKNEDGMLEFLEDIIGSVRFKNPISLLAGRLTDLTEIKTEKYQRVMLIEGEKNELADERNEALTYLQLENDITQARNKLFQKELYSMKAIEEEAKKTRVVVDEEAKGINEKCQEVLSLIKEKNKVYTEFIKKCNKTKNEKDKNKEKFQWYEEQDVKIQEEVKHLLSTVKKLEKNIQQDKTNLQELNMVPEKQEKDIKVMKKTMEKMEVEKKEQEQKFDEVMATFQDETKDLQADKFKKETELLEVQKTVSDHKQKFQLSQGELDLLKSSQNKEVNKMAEMKRSVSCLEASKQEKMGILTESKERFPGIKDSLEKAKSEFEALNEAEKNKRVLVKELSTKVEIARSNLHSAQNQNQVLEFLMSLKRSGKVPEILGRLGDLGAINKQYDVAISTACGLLDYIVVENMDSAQRCIEELRSANVGRSSFIGLDRMSVWKEHCRRKNRTFPENVPRLFDLVTINNPALEPAFYFALRDTLVAKDIHQATRIAYGSTRYRVVTLGGELIDLSGSMSGGGKKVARGKMGSQIKADVNPRELQKMEVELEKAQRDMQSGHEDRFRLHQSIETLQKSHREVATCIQKLSNEIKSIQDQLEGFMAQLKVLEEKVKRNKPDEKKISGQEKKVETLKMEYEQVQKVATDMEDQIHKVHNEIMEIGGNQFKSIETKKSLLESQLEQHRSSINKLIVAVKTAQRKATKTESNIELMRTEMKESSEKLIAKREEKGKIEVDAHKLLDTLNKNEADLKESQTELSRISGVISEYTDQEKESKRLLQDAKYRLEKAQEDEKQASEKFEAIKLRLNSLELHDIDDRPKEQLEKLRVEEAEKINSQDMTNHIVTASTKLNELKPNMASIQEYKKKEDIYLKRVEEYTKISTLKESQKRLHDELKKRRNDEFMTGYSRIKSKLKEMYQAITMGGNAELELVDTMDAFAEGIVFSVRPPRKSWKNISNLSGGEKTLSSLALIFALHQYKATPFYVMDEIDAALDFKNASIVANYIKHRTENAQFIVISLRSNTFELCDSLIGIYKTFNSTKSITLNLAKNKITKRLKSKNIAGDNATASSATVSSVGSAGAAVSSLGGAVSSNGARAAENGGGSGGDGVVSNNGGGDVFSRNKSVAGTNGSGGVGMVNGSSGNPISSSSGVVESCGSSSSKIVESSDSDAGNDDVNGKNEDDATKKKDGDDDYNDNNDDDSVEFFENDD